MKQNFKTGKKGGVLLRRLRQSRFLLETRKAKVKKYEILFQYKKRAAV